MQPSHTQAVEVTTRRSWEGMPQARRGVMVGKTIAWTCIFSQPQAHLASAQLRVHAGHIHVLRRQKKAGGRL